MQKSFALITSFGLTMEHEEIFFGHAEMKLERTWIKFARLGVLDMIARRVLK